MKIGISMTQGDCLAFPYGHDVIVMNFSQFLTDTFSFVRVSSVLKVEGEETAADSKQTKTRRIKNPYTSSSAHKLWVA